MRSKLAVSPCQALPRQPQNRGERACPPAPGPQITMSSRSNSANLRGIEQMPTHCEKYVWRNNNYLYDHPLGDMEVEGERGPAMGNSGDLKNMCEHCNPDGGLASCREDSCKWFKKPGTSSTRKGSRGNSASTRSVEQTPTTSEKYVSTASLSKASLRARKIPANDSKTQARPPRGRACQRRRPVLGPGRAARS